MFLIQVAEVQPAVEVDIIPLTVVPLREVLLCSLAAIWDMDEYLVRTALFSIFMLCVVRS